jgi:sugar lactone lactonase YvrE
MNTRLTVCLAAIGFLTKSALLAAGFGMLPTANLVIGQSDFTSSSQPAVPNPTSLNAQTGIAVDPTTGKVFVADSGNNRILRYASASSLTKAGANAEAVFGQINFSNNLANENAANPTGASLSNPQGIFVDSAGRLWVADTNNNRVLLFFNASTQPTHASADRVFGQATFLTKTAAAGATGMNAPLAVSVDSTGRLWTLEFSNHRALRFDDAINKVNGAAADGVLGQPDFATTTAGLTGAKFNGPRGISADSTGHLWVVDDERVLRFDNAAAKLDGAGANGVLGQPDFTTNTTGTTAQKFNFPTCVFADASGRVWVGEFTNRRVVYFDKAASKANGGAADGVIGEPNLTTSAGGGITAQYVAAVYLGLWVDGGGSVWVSDTNGRILRFSPSAASLPMTPHPAVAIAGKKKITTSAATLKLKGTASDIGGTLARVEVKVGKAGFKPARGTAAWKFTARLEPGKNVILVRAVDAAGSLSTSARMTVIRK